MGRGVLLYITCGVNGIVEFMRTSFLLLMIFFTSYVTMLDFVYLVFRRLLIILQTNQCVKDGPSLLISLHQVDLLPDLWSIVLSPGCGRYLGCISCARDVGFCLVGCCGSCLSYAMVFFFLDN